MARKLTELGYKLKIKLLQEGKTQSWFAAQFGISRQQLTNVLYGESNLFLEIAMEKYIEEGVIDDNYNNKKQ